MTQTPTEKAKELYEAHLHIIYQTLFDTGDGKEARELAINAAKLTCDQIFLAGGDIAYWAYVREGLGEV